MDIGQLFAQGGIALVMVVLFAWMLREGLAEMRARDIAAQQTIQALLQRLDDCYNALSERKEKQQ